MLATAHKITYRFCRLYMTVYTIDVSCCTHWTVCYGPLISLHEKQHSVSQTIP